MKTEVPKKINDHSYTLRCPKLQTLKKNILENGTFFYIMPFHRFFPIWLIKKIKMRLLIIGTLLVYTFEIIIKKRFNFDKKKKKFLNITLEIKANVFVKNW